MSTKVSVRLPKELAAALAAAAARLDRKRSEVVRMALDQFLRPGGDSVERAADRARGLIGSLDSGMPDLAEDHEIYLIESIRRGG